MVSVKLLEQYMNSGLNILITGAAGTGKTTMLQQAAKNLGWKMKYYSTSTLDPFADLIGVPVPNMGRKSVDYYRPRELDTADVVFFDELNRGDLMVLNAVFEIIQFKSINGERLDQLKCVVAAVNPVEDGYATRTLDTALKDRFDLYLESDPDPSVPYFRAKYGDNYAAAGLSLYKDYVERKKAGEKLEYFSPRRLDKLMEIYNKFGFIETVQAVVPSRDVDHAHWANVLNAGKSLVSEVQVSANLEQEIQQSLEGLKTNFTKSEYTKKLILNTYLQLKKLDHPELKLIKKKILMRLNEMLQTPEDFNYWSPLISGLSKDEFSILTKDWPDRKKQFGEKVAFPA